MSPTAHLLASWISGVSFKLEKKDVRIISFAGLAPDIDGAGFLIDKINSFFGKDTDFYSDFHHVFGHGLLSALIISSVAMLLSKKRKMVVYLVSLFVSHLHYLCDLIGSGGPDKSIWSITYLYPISDAETSFSWQWSLNGWQNITILGALSVISIYLSSKVNHSPIGVISAFLDREMFKMVDKYWISRKKPKSVE